MKNDHTNKQIEQIYQKNATKQIPKNLDDLIILEAQNSCRPKQHKKWIFSLSTAAALIMSLSLLINIQYNQPHFSSNTFAKKKPMETTVQPPLSDGTNKESSGISLKSLKQKNTNTESNIESLAEYDLIQDQSNELESEIQPYNLPQQKSSKISNDINEKKFNKKHISSMQFDNPVINSNDISTDLTHLSKLIDTNQKKQALLLLDQLIKKYPDYDFNYYKTEISSM